MTYHSEDDLFDNIKNKDGAWYAKHFDEFDKANPIVWELFEKFALMAASRRPRFSHWAVFNRIRWATAIEYTEPEHNLKLNNNWCAHYARKFMRVHPQHKGFFLVKASKYIEGADE